MTFTVSAPGKVILFGEHSVVHNQPAIAAAVGLRTYILVNDNVSDSITLILHDMNFKHTWKISELPFIPFNESKDLNDNLVAKLEQLLGNINNTFAHAAAMTFLYLYCSICSEDTPGNSFSVKSFLPVGSGLGSSASYSVCIASALLKVSNKPLDFEKINTWAFLGEKCIHGNPSGIDNAVATQGGAVYFQRNPSKLENMGKFPPLKLLLTNTKVPRRTSELVAGVGNLLERMPQVMQPILTAMGKLVDQTHSLLTESDTDISQAGVLSKKLAELARLNHGLLVSIGVSHPSLEQIKTTSDVLKLGETKLTGAGGGGCAITIVTDDDPHKIEKFKTQMPEFSVFETTLGARGVGYVDCTLSADEFPTCDANRLDSLGEWHYW